MSPDPFLRDAPFYTGLPAIVKEALGAGTPLAVETALDRRRWSCLEELETGTQFDLGRLVVYRLKLLLLERKNRFRPEPGRESFTQGIRRYWTTRPRGQAPPAPNCIRRNKMTKGKVVGVNGNMVTVEVEGDVSMNEVAYVVSAGKKLKSEVIRIRGRLAEMQVFEMSRGIGVGDEVEFTAELLSVRLGPGLLAQIYDGLQNPLPELAARCGFFLERGVYLSPLDEKKKWPFTPAARPGDPVTAGDTLGTVPEGIFSHRIMVPFQHGADH